jgi:hypothetical protein
MRIITIRVRCPLSRSEMVTTHLDDARLVVEAAVSLALLELCGEVWVDEVCIEDEPSDDYDSGSLSLGA